MPSSSHWREIVFWASSGFTISTLIAIPISSSFFLRSRCPFPCGRWFCGVHRAPVRAARFPCVPLLAPRKHLWHSGGKMPSIGWFDLGEHQTRRRVPQASCPRVARPEQPWSWTHHQEPSGFFVMLHWCFPCCLLVSMCCFSFLIPFQIEFSFCSFHLRNQIFLP